MHDNRRFVTADAPVTARMDLDRAKLRKAARLWLKESGVLAKAVQVGEMVPDFALPDARGGSLGLAPLLDHGAVVVLFTLGAVCADCRRMLSAFSDIAADFTAARARVVAISPDPVPVSGKLMGDRRLQVPVLADVDGRLRRLFGIAYAPPAPVSLWFELLGLPSADPRFAEDLPLPAAYVVAPSGIATFAWLRADPLARAEPTAILEAVRSSR